MAEIVGTEEQDYVRGTAEDDVQSGGGGNDYIYASAGDDVIDGGAGSDMLLVSLGVAGVVVDLAAGTAVGEGNDRLTGIEKVHGSGADDVLIGNAEDNDFYGDAGADQLSGGGGNDYLDAGYYDLANPVDRLDGGDGDDTVEISLDDVADGGPGFDTLRISLYHLDQGVEVDLRGLWGGGTAAVGSGTVTGFEWVSSVSGTRGADEIIVGTGGTGHANTLVLGAGGDDRLTGGDHRETLSGGAGDDLLSGLGGEDWLSGGEGDDRLEGGDGDDTLIGDAGSGDAGADVLVGGPGNDTYLYSNGTSAAGDRFIEDPDDPGFDVVEYHPYLTPVEDSAFTDVRNVEGARLAALTDWAGAEFLLGAEFQASGISTVIASGDVDGSALTSGVEFVVTRLNSRPLTVTAGSGDDSFRFGQLTLPADNDYVLSAGEGFDTLHLEGPIDAGWWRGEILLSGFEAVIIAGEGDTASRTSAMGLSSPTRYYSVAPTDTIMEAGTLFTVDARELGLGGASEILTVDGSQLTGGRAVRVLGGSGSDAVSGSVADDALRGGAGNDAVDGGEGADQVAGDGGADTLRGGAGADRMAGGLGNDVFYVDNAGDVVVELAAQGSDTVRTSVSYRLPDHVEQLVLTGGGAISGRGNALANVITGNNAGNRLDGKAGADTMTGGLGNDTYVVDSRADKVVETGSSGTDTVESAVEFTLPTHVEKLVIVATGGRIGVGNSGDNAITGNAGADTLKGSGGNDVIDGGAGNDLLYGGAGNDSLRGGSGLDRFLFNTAPGSFNVDRILDFSVPDDTINLARTVFTGAGANGTLGAAAFHKGAAAADAGDRIVYDQATGKIFYDPDGTGAAAQLLVATVTAGTPLTHADFVIYG